VSPSPFRRSSSSSSARFGLALAAVAATLAGFGCSANVIAEPTGTGAQRLAVVEVRLRANAVDPEGRLDASARFVAVREPGVASDALELLGLTYREPPVGTCAGVDTDAALRPLPAVRVDLRDLSPVSVEIRGEEGDSSALALEPRAFPDVGGLVSGVVFVSPGMKPTRSTPRAVVVSVAGARLGDLDLPELPRVQLPTSVTTEEGLVVDAKGFDLLSASTTADGRISVDVVRAGVTRARCGADASGRVRIDAASVGGPGETVLVVREQRRLLREDATLGSVDTRVSREIELKVVAR
jgi:hypothetical protein